LHDSLPIENLARNQNDILQYSTILGTPAAISTPALAGSSPGYGEQNRAAHCNLHRVPRHDGLDFRLSYCMKKTVQPLLQNPYICL